MKVQVLAVSQKTPDWVKTACDLYLKRLPSDWQLELKEVRPAPRQQGKTADQMKTQEGERLLAALKERTGYKIALDERGKTRTTMQLHQLLEAQKMLTPEVTFVIGGPDGLAPEVRQACDMQLQLSAMTLPHSMVKVFLYEQIYRVAAIANNHPYHRE